MISYVIEQPNVIKPAETTHPEPGAEEVVVKVKHIGLCGSDIHLFNGTYAGPHLYPVMFGHEWSGIIESVGKKVEGLKPGDKVTGDCSYFCGECEYCQEDKNVCRSIEKYGITRDGASSEYILRDQKYIYRAPDDIDLSLLSMTEPLTISKHLLAKMEPCIGDLKDKKVLVFGAGAVGLGAIAILVHDYRCKNVDILEISQKRIDVALKLGAHLPEKKNLEVRESGSGYGYLYDAVYDLVLDTTGRESTFQQAFHLVRPLGAIGCIGMMSQATIPQKLIVLKALKVFGGIGGTGSFPAVIEFIHTHPEVVHKLISHQLSIDEAAHALELGQNSEASTKIILDL